MSLGETFAQLDKAFTELDLEMANVKAFLATSDAVKAVERTQNTIRGLVETLRPKGK